MSLSSLVFWACHVYYMLYYRKFFCADQLSMLWLTSTIPSLFKHMMVADLWFFSIVPLFNLSLTATKMVDVKKECNVEFYHIISKYSSNFV